ncbi:MAG: hypothetical protein IPF99_14860 [Deltaproteobacteria bacterium]|nr:hypothetical protein [Deltaproteobacteria bacterium]
MKERYEEAILADSGVRFVDPKMQYGFDPQKLTVWADVALEQDFVFPVPGRAEGEAFVSAAGDGARLVFDPAKDAWFVVRKKGSVVKVARAARLNRYVAGQVPGAWDPVRYGIPKDLAEQVDRTTLYNLIATVEAFLSAGLEPEELYQYLHPSDVGSTQGAGIGGMQKLRRLYLDHALDRPRQGDALQETLINVTAAWVVQTLVGSYGPMVHPVGACATAAVSLEEAADKVLGGKAAFIVAGGFDDYGEEGALGFSDMAATCDTDDMLARSIPSEGDVAPQRPTPPWLRRGPGRRHRARRSRRPRGAHGPAHLRSGRAGPLLRRRDPPQHPRSGPWGDGRGRRAQGERGRGERRGAVRPGLAKHCMGGAASEAPRSGGHPRRRARRGPRGLRASADLP